MGETTESIPTVFARIAELAVSLDINPISNLPGIWLYHLDHQWTFAVNGHRRTILVEPKDMMEAQIPPYSCAIWFNGWLAGFFDPSGGIMAAGSAANEDAFIAALESAILGAQVAT